MMVFNLTSRLKAVTRSRILFGAAHPTATCQHARHAAERVSFCDSITKQIERLAHDL